MLVTRHVTLNFGKHDWLLFLPSFGIPGILGITFAALDILGPNGY